MSSPSVIPESRLAYPNVEAGADLGGHPVWTADAIVVGSGTGGAVTAAALSDAGYDVLILEEGGLHRTQDFDTDPGRMVRKLYRDAGTTPIMGVPPILFAEGRCVGGSSVINGGMCWRTPEHVLDEWSKSYGLPEISPRAMEPYFERAEKILNVEVQREETWGKHSRLFAEASAKLGWEMEPNRRNMRHCMGLNNCGLGCPTGAKQSMLVTEIPRALELGARLVTNARVRKLRFSRGRVVGVTGSIVDERGRRLRGFDAFAPLVVLAAGARHTPGILLRSRVRSRALGRHLRTHPNAKVVGVFEDALDPWIGAHQTHQLHKFLKDGILIATSAVPPGLLATGLPGLGASHAARMRQYNHMVTAAALIEDTGEGRVRLGPDREPMMSFKLSAQDMETVHKGVSMTARILFEAGAREVLLPFSHLPKIDSVGELERVEELERKPGATELMTVHIMGSARMSTQPGAGVTDAYGRVHGVDGLAVADASLFPSSVGVNPQESIVALALRNVEHLARTIRREPRRRRD